MSVDSRRLPGRAGFRLPRSWNLPGASSSGNYHQLRVPGDSFPAPGFTRAEAYLTGPVGTARAVSQSAAMARNRCSWCRSSAWSPATAPGPRRMRQGDPRGVERLSRGFWPTTRSRTHDELPAATADPLSQQSLRWRCHHSRGPGKKPSSCARRYKSTFVTAGRPAKEYLTRIRPR